MVCASHFRSLLLSWILFFVSMFYVSAQQRRRFGIYFWSQCTLNIYVWFKMNCISRKTIETEITPYRLPKLNKKKIGIRFRSDKNQGHFYAAFTQRSWPLYLPLLSCQDWHLHSTDFHNFFLNFFKKHFFCVFVHKIAWSRLGINVYIISSFYIFIARRCVNEMRINRAIRFMIHSNHRRHHNSINIWLQLLVLFKEFSLILVISFYLYYICTCSMSARMLCGHGSGMDIASFTSSNRHKFNIKFAHCYKRRR